MKKFILSCIVAILCVCAAAAVAVYIGNLPSQSYWPNKQVRVSVPRRFFVPNGIAKVYHENGKLSYQYQIINNINNGEVRFYLPSKTVTMHYLNGNLLGIVDIKPNLKQENQPLMPKIVFESGNGLKISYNQDGNNTVVTGKRVCADDDFIARLEAYSATANHQTFEHLLSCFSIETLSYKNPIAECSFKGEYVYPNYKSNVQTVCSLLNENEGLIKDFKNVKVESLYTAQDDTLKLKAFDKQKPQSNIALSYKGIKTITQAAIDAFLFPNASHNTAPFIPVVLENLSFSDAHLVVNNKKIWNIKGDLNLKDGFSSPYYISSYTDNAVSSQIKISSDGVDLKALYPVSGTPMFSLGLKINTSFKIKYKELAQEISKLITEKLDKDNVDYANTLAALSEYMWEFSDLFNSVYFNLKDIQGQTALNVLVSLKKGISSEEIADNPMDAFTTEITTYQDGEPVHQAVGNFEKGFTIDDEQAEMQDVLALLNNTTLNAVLEDIGNELELKYAPIIEKAQTPEDYIGVDPFFLGLYTGYKESIHKYKLTQTIAQITTLVLNLQALYEDDGDYENLKASELLEAGVITPEMLDSKNTLLNAFGGKIRILKSPAEEDLDEYTAFILVYEGLPSDVCFELATLNWSEITDKFIAVKATSSGTANVTKAFKDEPFEKRASGTVYHPYEAQAACGKSNTSSIALKFE